MKTEQNKFYSDYIIRCITDYEGNAIPNKRDAVQFLKNRFDTEYSFAIDRYGYFKAMTDWLQGLAIDIAYMNNDIITLAKFGESIPENATEKQEDKIIDNYWEFMASKTIQLFAALRTKKSIFFDEV